MKLFLRLDNVTDMQWLRPKPMIGLHISYLILRANPITLMVSRTQSLYSQHSQPVQLQSDCPSRKSQPYRRPGALFKPDVIWML